MSEMSELEDPEMEDPDKIDHQKIYEKKQKEYRVNAKKKLKKVSYEELLDNEVKRAEIQALSAVSIGNMGLVVTKSNAQILPVQVSGDKKLTCGIYGEKKELAIFHEPQTCFMDMRNYWIIGGIIQRIKFKIAMMWLRILGMSNYGLLKFNLYLFRADGEYTLDPSQDLTPLENQRLVEAFLKIANPELQGKAMANMLEGLGDPEPWWKTAQWLITILLIVAMFLFVMNGGF